MSEQIKHLEFKINNLTNKYEELKRSIAIQCVEESLFVINREKKVENIEALLERNPQQIQNNFGKGIENTFGARRKKAEEIIGDINKLEGLKHQIRQTLDLKNEYVNRYEKDSVETNKDDKLDKGVVFQKIHAAILASDFTKEDKLEMELGLIAMYSGQL